MDGTRTRGRLAATCERTRGVHPRRFSAKQRLHLAALLILLAAFPLQGQSDIDFDPAITQEQFSEFARVVAQAIYHTPVEPARAGNLLRFDIGVAGTAVAIDPGADFWQNAVADDFTISDHVVVPRLVVSKGLSFITVSGSYAEIQDTDISILGAAVDVPILDGGLVRPTIAVRGSYARVQGVDDFALDTAGAEVFVSKSFGPITPYAAAGLARSDAEALIVEATSATPEVRFTDESNTTRFTAGVKISLLFPKIVVEATQGEERSYAAKVSFGF